METRGACRGSSVGRRSKRRPFSNVERERKKREERKGSVSLWRQRGGGRQRSTMAFVGFGGVCLVGNASGRCSRPQRRRRPATGAAAIPQMILSAERVESLQMRAESVRCPFLRRRAGDVVDALVVVAQWLSSRHKRLDFRTVEESVTEKWEGLSVQEVLGFVKDDFVVRRYYITGRLTSELYRNTCRFEGPDPDLPIVGLKKYVDAASNLFDRKRSTCDLLSIKVTNERQIVAQWRLEGVLRLPWKPAVKAFLGRTVFDLDDQGLIHRHSEEWSIAAFDAFVSTLVFHQFGTPPAPPLAELPLLSHDDGL